MSVIDVTQFVDPDFGPDPYFARVKKLSPCGDEHLRYMFRIVWPALASDRKVLVAQRAMTTYRMLGMIAVGDRDLDYLGGGHVLYVDYPGKGKTLIAKVPALIFGGTYARFQGANDNLPSDITGNRVSDGKGGFEILKGPVFADVLLGDELNRSTTKALAGLLQALSEGQVTIFGKTYAVHPFGIFTMNPIETEGTFPLPEALLDRIMFKITGEWTFAEQFADILERTSDFREIRHGLKQLCDMRTIYEIREYIHKEIYIDPEIRLQMGRFAEASNDPHRFGLLRSYERMFDAGRDVTMEGSKLIVNGLSPRGVVHWEGAAKALAFMRYRNHVRHEDVKKVLLPIMRHRIQFASSVIPFFTHALRQYDSAATTDVLLGALMKEVW